MLTAPQIVLGIALKCLPPLEAQIAAGMALHENPKVDMQAVNHNANGTTDYGLAQINSSNFPWLSQSLQTLVNEHTIFDPCINLRASLRVLFARYNGNPPDVVKAAYAAGAASAVRQVEAASPPSPAAEPEDPPPPSWDMEAVAEWRRRHDPTPEGALLAPPDGPAIPQTINQERHP